MRKKNVDYTDMNTNDVQFSGSCSSQGIGNASEISYFSELGKVRINMNLFWKWREEIKGIPASKGAMPMKTYALLEEFEDFFGGLPVEFSETGERGVVRLPAIVPFGEDITTHERLRRATREIGRKGGYGVTFFLPVNSDTFSNCNKGGSMILNFTGNYASSHEMTIEGYTNLEYRNITFSGITKREPVPEVFKIGNSWGQEWGIDGVCLLKGEDFDKVYKWMYTMVTFDRNDDGSISYMESKESSLDKDRVLDYIEKIKELPESKFKEEFLNFYL